jgi:hypothetical protein
MQSVPITTDVRLNLNQGGVYNIIWSSVSVTCDRSVVSSTNKTYRHDIAEILLKVALNTMKQTSIKVFVLRNKKNVVEMLVCCNFIGNSR